MVCAIYGIPVQWNDYASDSIVINNPPKAIPKLRSLALGLAEGFGDQGGYSICSGMAKSGYSRASSLQGEGTNTFCGQRVFSINPGVVPIDVYRPSYLFRRISCYGTRAALHPTPILVDLSFTPGFR